MGSRYGSLKQIDPMGPSGETIIDYSVYDALRAGFGKVVFIIRESMEADFKEVFGKRFKDKIQVEYVFQELHKVPSGVAYHPERQKPWGTAHAVMMAKDVIQEPFAVINADDYYGRESFKTLADYLTSLPAGDAVNYCMVGYKIKNTLSEFGSVSRGVCVVNPEGYLDTVTERTKIQRNETGNIVFEDEHGQIHPLHEDTLVSMNMWGCLPSIFEHGDYLFTEFLRDKGMELKSEFYIPTLISFLIQSGQAKVKMLTSDASWFGVTYKEDKPLVMESLNKLVQMGEYPEKLWD